VERVCYFVEPRADKWIVWFDDPVDAEIFASRAAAIEAARRSARTRWETFSRSSCVCIRADGDEWIHDLKFGPDVAST
jgi:hypothetical protein